MRIAHRTTAARLFQDAATTLRATVIAARKAGADLSEADLSGTDLSSWGTSAHVAALMRYDAANHPKGTAPFTAWAKGGPCPYASCAFGRAAQFTENKAAWRAGPPLSALTLVRRLFAEQLVRTEAV